MNKPVKQALLLSAYFSLGEIIVNTGTRIYLYETISKI